VSDGIGVRRLGTLSVGLGRGAASPNALSPGVSVGLGVFCMSNTPKCIIYILYIYMYIYVLYT
jgi:hypothetical protein